MSLTQIFEAVKNFYRHNLFLSHADLAAHEIHLEKSDKPRDLLQIKLERGEFDQDLEERIARYDAAHYPSELWSSSSRNSLHYDKMCPEVQQQMLAAFFSNHVGTVHTAWLHIIPDAMVKALGMAMDQVQKSGIGIDVRRKYSIETTIYNAAGLREEFKKSLFIPEQYSTCINPDVVDGWHEVITRWQKLIDTEVIGELKNTAVMFLLCQGKKMKARSRASEYGVIMDETFFNRLGSFVPFGEYDQWQIMALNRFAGKYAKSFQRGVISSLIHGAKIPFYEHRMIFDKISESFNNPWPEILEKRLDFGKDDEPWNYRGVKKWIPANLWERLTVRHHEKIMAKVEELIQSEHYRSAYDQRKEMDAPIDLIATRMRSIVNVAVTSLLAKYSNRSNHYDRHSVLRDILFFTENFGEEIKDFQYSQFHTLVSQYVLTSQELSSLDYKDFSLMPLSDAAHTRLEQSKPFEPPETPTTIKGYKRFFRYLQANFVGREAIR